MYKKNDFVYLDPPYNNSKSLYIKSLKTEELCNELEKLNSNNVNWMLSYDGIRNKTNYALDAKIPKDLYRYCYVMPACISSMSNVLNQSTEYTNELVYVNYEPTTIVSQQTLL